MEFMHNQYDDESLEKQKSSNYLQKRKRNNCRIGSPVSYWGKIIQTIQTDQEESKNQ